MGGGDDVTGGAAYDEVVELLRRYMLGGADPQINVTDSTEELTPPQGLLGPGGVPWNANLDDGQLVVHIPILHNNLGDVGAAQGLEADRPNASSDRPHVCSPSSNSVIYVR